MPPKRSLYKQYEDALCKYYGTERSPLAYAPPVRNIDVAHQIALQVDSYLSSIDEAEIAESAARGLRREPPQQQTADRLAELVDDSRAHRLRLAVVNTELTHARLAPGDFNPDQEQAGAYEMGIGTVILPLGQAPTQE